MIYIICLLTRCTRWLCSCLRQSIPLRNAKTATGSLLTLVQPVQAKLYSVSTYIDGYHPDRKHKYAYYILGNCIHFRKHRWHVINFILWLASHHQFRKGGAYDIHPYAPGNNLSASQTISVLKKCANMILPGIYMAGYLFLGSKRNNTTAFGKE